MKNILKKLFLIVGGIVIMALGTVTFLDGIHHIEFYVFQSRYVDFSVFGTGCARIMSGLSAIYLGSVIGVLRWFYEDQ